MRSNEDILNEIHHAKTHSPSAKKVFRNAVKQYCNQQQSNLDQLIKEADTEEDQRIRWRDRKLKQRLLSFRQHLIENYKKNTVQSYFNAIKSIYSFYEIEIGDLPSLNLKSVNTPEPINYVDLPTKDIIKKALKIADPRMKAIILFMSSSGCAKKETLSLTIQDFIDATNEYHNANDIYEVIHQLKDRDDIIPMFRLKRQKTNKYYYTFCSPEAVQAIILHLLKVDQELKKDEKLNPEDKLFPIHEDYVTMLFIELNNTLKLGKKGTYNRLRSHMLRKFHASRLYNDGLTLDEVDALQGRSKDSTHSAYFMENPKHLKEKYIQHLDCITINMDVNNLDIKSPEFVKLENENSTLKSELGKMDDILARLSKLEANSGD